MPRSANSDTALAVLKSEAKSFAKRLDCAGVSGAFVRTIVPAQRSDASGARATALQALRAVRLPP